MDYKLSKCARCAKLFNKIMTDVCLQCQPEEDADFTRIRDVLVQTKGLNATQVADQAGVTIDCVVRMLREGRIENVSHDSDVTCGRCGAPAISETKRLCQRCLVDLDRECAHAMHEMRARLMAKQATDMNDVADAVANKRTSRREKRREDQPTAPQSNPQSVRLGQRMVIPDHLRKGVGRKP